MTQASGHRRSDARRNRDAILAAALVICLPPPAAVALFWIAVGLGIAAALVGIFWAIFCPRPCAWPLLFSWQVLIGVGAMMLCFTVCCPTFWWVGVPLLAAGVALMFVWKNRCKESMCEIWKELFIAISGVIIPALGYIADVPVLAACLNHPIVIGLSLLATAVGLAAQKCKA